MKKILLFCFALLSSIAICAQGTIKNDSYVNLVFCQPIGNYGLTKDATGDNLHEVYISSAASEVTRYHGGLQFGTNFYIHRFSDVVKPGITVDYVDLEFQYYKFKPLTDGDTPNSDLLATYSFNVGAICTVSPFKDFYIDVTGKLYPTFGVGYTKLTGYTSAFENKALVAGPTSKSYNDEESSMVYGLNYGAGIGIRYKLVQFGCEFIFGRLAYDYENWDKQKLYNSRVAFKFGFYFE